MIDCRKNIYALTPTEWTNFTTAVDMLKSSGEYEDFVKRHYVVRLAAHRGPAFLPWHRYYIREFELALQSKIPGVTLPYWNWAEDLGPDPNSPLDPMNGAIWNTNPADQVYIGGNGDPTDSGKINTGPFTGWTIFEGPINGELPPNSTTRPMQDVLDDLDNLGIFAPMEGIRRFLGSGSTQNPFFPTQAQIDGAIVNYPTYDTTPWDSTSNGSFRNRVEGWLQEPGEVGEQLHNRIHTWIDGSMSPPTSPNDPVFFLHHCNIDRIWAAWQRVHPNSGYEPVSGGPMGHNLNDVMPFLRTPGATPAGSLNYARDIGFMYDTDLPFPELETPSIMFNDVPEGVETARAAVFGILDGCRDQTLNFQITSPIPAPFAAPFGTTATYDPATSADDKVRMFLSYQGTTAGAMHSGSIDVLCVETGMTETIMIDANTVAKPSVACALVLDRSGSMLADAGLGNGQRRIDVLQDAAPTLVDLLQDQDGIGVASFNQDSSVDMPLAVAGPPSMLPGVGPRGQANTAISGLMPGGATSIGDGIVEGLGMISNGPQVFNADAVVVFTDGHENSDEFLSSVSGQINARVFALGLGRPEVLQPQRLMDISHGTDGFMMMTGDALTDSLRLQKYFVQILSGVDNSQIVLDPDGRLLPGNEVEIPFNLHRYDTAADVIVLAPAGDIFDSKLVSPTGLVLDPVIASSGLTGVQLIEGKRVQAYRLQLPIQAPQGEGHAGRWKLTVALSDERFKDLLLRSDEDRSGLRRLRSQGVPYTVVVRATSNLSLRVRTKYESREPGGLAVVTASLTELNLPFRGEAKVFMELTGPFDRQLVIPADQTGPGTWAMKVELLEAGVYTGRLRVEGASSNRQRFTREQLLTLSAWEGGDKEPFDGQKPPVPKGEHAQDNPEDHTRSDGTTRPTIDFGTALGDTQVELPVSVRARLFDQIMHSFNIQNDT